MKNASTKLPKNAYFDTTCQQSQGSKVDAEHDNLYIFFGSKMSLFYSLCPQKCH